MPAFGRERNPYRPFFIPGFFLVFFCPFFRDGRRDVDLFELLAECLLVDPLFFHFLLQPLFVLAPHPERRLLVRVGAWVCEMTGNF